jgi:hypothetical protein
VTLSLSKDRGLEEALDCHQRAGAVKLISASGTQTVGAVAALRLTHKKMAAHRALTRKRWGQQWQFPDETF